MNDRMRVVDYFDSVYAQHDRFWWQEPARHALNPDEYPFSLLTQQTLRLLAGRPTGRALDLGAGEGADAIRLALLGYEVDAVDRHQEDPDFRPGGQRQRETPRLRERYPGLHPGWPL
jgi:SAM-dependent methyltransferase